MTPLLDCMELGYVVSQARLASLIGKGLLNCMYKLFPIDPASADQGCSTASQGSHPVLKSAHLPLSHLYC